MEKGSPAPLFAAIKYKELDYDFEAITHFKVIRDCLALPTLYDVSSDVYPHTGHLTGDAYRRPWIRGTVFSTCKLFVNGSILDDLRGQHQPVHLLFERLGDKGELMDIVPSSDPNSQGDLDEDKLAVLLQESGADLTIQECFCKSTTTDHMSITNNPTDLLLEEVVEPLAAVKSHLPSLKAKLSRLSGLPVSDPLLNTNSLSEELILRHCAPYEVPAHVDSKGFTTSSHVNEEFHTEAVLNHDSLLLPVCLETLSLYKENYCSLHSIEQVLQVAPEPLEHQVSTLDVLRKANPQASQLAVDISQLDPPKEMAADIRMDGSPLDSTVHTVLFTELELDRPLTPPTRATPTLLQLSDAQLPLEERSPVHRLSLVSQGDQQEMELAVWKAEKHLNCVLGFLLTEPQAHDPAVVFQPVAHALGLLNKEALEGVDASGVAEDLQSQALSVTAVPGLCFSFCEFTENLTPGSSSAKEPNVEVFTALSPEHIECILTTQEEDSVPVSVSVKGVKSILKKPVPSDRPAIPINVDISTCAVRQNKVPVSQVHQRWTDASHEKQQGETSSLLPAASVSNTTAREPFLVCESTFQDLKDASSHVTRPANRNESQQSLCASSRAERAKSAQLLLRNNERSLLAEKDPDPLSTFMMLRSQQTSPDPESPQPCPGSTGGAKVQQPIPAKPQSQHSPGPCSWPITRTGVIGHSKPEPAAQSPSPALPGPPVTQDQQECRVVCVQATESVWRAYRELLAVAQPCLSRATELGLSCPAWGDFSSIAPDQTRFLLRQQEKELCRQPGEDKELLFNQVALIHVLVTFKDMMLQCDLITAVEYLAQAAVACSGQRLEQLLKRLRVVVYLSHQNQEPNPKVPELQDQLVSWLQTRTGHSSSDKVLILSTVDDDNTRATLVRALAQASGEAVAAVCPEEGQPKLNGATVISSVCGVVCVVACTQHIGADFPWSCFSLVVEYDRPGHSPWGAICKEKNIHHLCFLTSLPRLEVLPACLEEIVPFVCLVTDGLLNQPLLLQTLETRYNISVLERSYSPALQMFGGTHHYVVVTVDESTAIVIQDQEELGQVGYSERVVMRLTALSLQYSRCWLILHCPDSKTGGSGLSSEAFSSLVLLHASLVLFGMKSEDLDVKVLVVAEEADVARWVSRICFHCLMSSDREPSVYLDLRWLAVTPSEDDCCLSLFPCVNPLVSQLMLRRAPSLTWLLGASLSELEPLLPEVPHKILKVFSDTTSLYQLSREPSSPDLLPPTTQTTLWTSGAYTPHPPSPTNCPSEPSSADSAFHLLFSEPGPSTAVRDINADLRAHQSVSFGGHTYLQGAWSRKEPQQDEKEAQPVQSEVDDWIKRIIGSSGSSTYHPHTTQSSPYQPHTTLSSSYHPHTTQSSPYHPHTTQSSPYQPHTTLSSSYHPHTTQSSPYHPHTTQSSPYHPHTTQSSPYHPHTTAGGSLHPAGSFSSASTCPTNHLQLFCTDRPNSEYCVPGPRPPVEPPAWGVGSSRGPVGSCSGNGWRGWTLGLERKRSGPGAGPEDSELPPPKRGRLGFEKVPGRCDGQTRLRFL